MSTRPSLGLVIAVALAACSTSSERTASQGAPAGEGAVRSTDTPRRVVLVIADDLGVDALRAYADLNGADAEDRSYPATPTIDRICSQGVRFTQAWAMPTCTPTRGSILTGRYGFRTGLDGVGRGKTIDPGEVTLPKILDGVAHTANGCNDPTERRRGLGQPRPLPSRHGQAAAHLRLQRAEPNPRAQREGQERGRQGHPRRSLQVHRVRGRRHRAL